MSDKSDVESFPMDCVKHLANCSCVCQFTGPDVDNNRHYESCMVGKAQAYLGVKVTEKKLWSWGGMNPETKPSPPDLSEEER